jgi:4a-hydroxytetrahydrobiopterin dehydratase
MLRTSNLLRKFSEVSTVKKAKNLTDLAKAHSNKLGVSDANGWVHSLSLKGWELGKDDKREFMKTTFKFQDFRQAFHFMELASSIADELDHHPEWFNVYNRVEVLLSTHTANGLTWKDMLLASYMQEFAKSASTKDFSKETVQSTYHLNPQQDQIIKELLTSVQKKLDKLQ